MATLIGVVSRVIGEVFAVAGDGTRRALVEGDRVFAGEQLVTGAGGAVAIALAGGGELTLGRDSNLMLDTQLLASARGDGTAAAAPMAETAPSDQDLTEVEQLQAAIEAGVDPTAALAATAAGPGAGGAGAGAGGNAGGGHSFVLLDETAGALDPVIGFPTAGLGSGPEFPDPDIVVTAEEPDSSPAVEVVYDDPSIDAGVGTVDEAALPGGSNPGSPNETTSGQLLITSPDGISSVQVQLQVQNIAGEWIDITNGGVVEGQYGTLTFDSAGNWVYTITTNTLDHAIPGATGAADQVAETFAIRVIDNDGDVSPAAPLIIQINDDGPTAVDDSNSVGEDAVAAVTGNVLSNDSAGADGDKTVTTPGSHAGTYGQLALNADGSYSYTLYTDPATQAIIQGLGEGQTLSESFGYTMRDGDGDPSSATLTLTIQGADDGVTITGLDLQGGEVLVDEDDLPNGSDQSDPLSDSGTFAIGAPDGIASISIGGVSFSYAQLANAGSVNLVIDSPAGVLVINGYSGSAAGGTVSYTYTLQDPVSNAPGSDQASESFAVVVTDVDGSSANDTLDVTIIDDQPIAANDSNSLGEDDSSVGGNVLTNDIGGADGGKTVTTPGSYAGTYGQLLLNADGSYSYTLYTDSATQAIIQGLSEGQTLSESFAYTMRDADNDTDSATLTLTIQGADDGVTITGLDLQGGEVLVDEDDLPNGSDQSDPLSDSGSFAIGAPDGIASISIGGVSFTYAQLVNAGSVNLVIDSPAGVLVINGYSGSETGGTVSYTYTLQEPVSNALGSNQASESFAVVVTDVDGSSANDSLDVTIIDDQPIAANDSNSLGEDDSSVGGNVLTNDIGGADGDKTVTTPGSHAGTYGQLLLNADGSYSYTLYTDPATQATLQGLSDGESLSDSFGYTMRDGDGDPSSATLTLTIQGADDGVTITGLDLQGGEVLVDEDDLPDGSSPDAAALSQSGTFVITAADGIASIGIGGVSFTYAQLANAGSVNLVIDSPAGVLVINGYSGSEAGGTVSYTYTLQDPVSNALGSDQASESFAVVVTDEDGSSSNATLDVTIVDDVPTAHADSNSVAEGGVVNGNVLTDGVDDVFGADGATVGGGIVGVKVGGDTGTPASGGVGALLSGSYGTLVLNADGSYTYDGFPDVVPPAGANDVFTYTIRDADGDLSTTTLTIGLTDGGLFAPLDNDVLVYESALDLNQDGADLAPGTVTGSLPGSTAETDASNQLNATGGVGALTYSLVGSATGSYGTIQINADGSYVYTLTSPYTSDPAADDGANIELGRDSFTYQVTDANGNTATGTILVDIVDDVPKAFYPDAAHVVLGVENPTPTTVTKSLNFLANAGADGVGSIAFSISDGQAFVDENGKQLYLDNEALFLFYDGDSQHIEARTLDGDVAFTAEIDVNGDMSITMFSGSFISNTVITSVTDLSGIGGGNVPFKGLNIGSKQNPDLDGSDDVLVSSEIMPLNDGVAGTVNSNANELGVGQGNELSNGEIIRYDLVTGLSINTQQNNESYSFGGYQQTFAFRQKLVVSGGSKDADFKLRIYDTSGSAAGANTSLVGTTAAAQLVLLVSEIVIYDANGNVQDNANHVAQDGSGVILYNLGNGWTFEIVSVDGQGNPQAFNAVEIEAIESANGSVGSDGTVTSFKLGEFSFGQTTDLDPVTFSLPVIGTDGDGDSVSSAIDVTVYPDSKSIEGTDLANVLTGDGGENYIFGYGGNDTLVGNGGDDILLGGLGDDSMSGGAGADIFRWQAGESGTDTVTDFVPGFNSGGDQLDLSDLLVGEHGAPGDIGNLLSYLDISTAGGDTLIKASSTAVADPAAAAEQTIVLQNVDLYASYGVGNEADLVLGMLGDGSLKVDTV